MHHDKIITPNSSLTIATIIVTTIILFILLRFFRSYFHLLPKKEKTREWIKKWTFFIELIIWLIYFAIITPIIYQTNTAFVIFYIIIVSCIILIYSYYFFRDYIAGIIFKLNYRIQIDDIIKIDNTIGRVRRLNSQHIVIESANNEIIYIPYSKIKNNFISKISTNEQSSICSFQISINSSEYNYNTLSAIKRFILTFPLVSTQSEPILNFIKAENSKTIIDISFISLDENKNEIIIESVKNKFEKSY